MGCFRWDFVLTANFKDDVKKLQETTEFLAYGKKMGCGAARAIEE